MEGRSGLKANGSVEGSSANYRVGIERILQLLVILMVGFDVDCVRAGRLESCRKLVNILKTDLKSLTQGTQAEHFTITEEAACKFFFFEDCRLKSDKASNFDPFCYEII